MKEFNYKFFENRKFFITDDGIIAISDDGEIEHVGFKEFFESEGVLRGTNKLFLCAENAERTPFALQCAIEG